jgi:2-polyprenyl-3-methyl-5-hydroxy-6-metoxy-1,4-benzoquinol methylase
VTDAPTAIHLPGGNDFDDLRIDVAASIARQTEWLATVPRRPHASSSLRGLFRQKRDALELRTHLREALVAGGVHHAWFDEFHSYWRNVLGGRPLTIQDFHHLRFHYRRRAQHTQAFDWSSPAAHLANWQEPSNLSATFFFVYRSALEPFRAPAELLGPLRRATRVLEYGCGMAPVYRLWRRYLARRDAEWVLADIANFPFHFARHVYAGEAEFPVIEDFDDPLRDVGGTFDVIVLQEVFEHLDQPRRVAEYLTGRLAPGGVFAFDYEKAEPLGHNTLAAVEQREETLEYLRGALRLDDASAERARAGDFVVAAT